MLSPSYLEDRHLTGQGAERARASHNTFFTMLVEHGVPGALLYIFIAFWIFKSIRRLRGRWREQMGSLPAVLPALAGMLAAIFVCDMFATYAKFEVRFWLIAALMALPNLMTASMRSRLETTDSAPVDSSRRDDRRLPAAAVSTRGESDVLRPRAQ